MTVPTPETWSTWTEMQRWCSGQSMSATAPAPPVRSSTVSCAPVPIDLRALRPTIWEVSVRPVGSFAPSSTVWFWTISAVTTTPSGMSLTAFTTVAVVGTVGVVGLPELLFPSRTKIATNATAARKTPTSRINRFERFKCVLPEPCDRWHHCSSGQRRRDYTNGLGPLEDLEKYSV